MGTSPTGRVTLCSVCAGKQDHLLAAIAVCSADEDTLLELGAQELIKEVANICARTSDAGDTSGAEHSKLASDLVGHGFVDVQRS